MKHIFTHIYDYLKARRKVRNLLLVSLFVVFGLGAYQIGLKEDISGFLPTTSTTKHVRFVANNIDGQSKIVINLRSQSGDKDYSIEASEYLVSAIDSLAGSYVDSIFYHIDEGQMLGVANFVCENLPYFIDSADYRRLDSLLVNDCTAEVLARNRDMLSTFMASVMEPILRRDPLSISGQALARLTALNSQGQYSSYQGYLFDKEFVDQVIVITPHWGTNSTAQNQGMDQALQSAVTHTLERYKEVDITYFGAPLIAVQNASQIKEDSLLALALSLVLILALMYYALRSFRSMVLVALPVIFGALFALCLIWIIQGSISAIAIGAGSIIFGIAISYSIHFVWHADHSSSAKDVIDDIVQPMTVGSLSTVGAFLSLLFIEAESMRDFGLFAALSLVGAIVFVLVFLPHLKPVSSNGKRRAIFNKISSFDFANGRYVVIGLIVVTSFLLIFASKTTFSSDMQKINYMSDTQRAEMLSIMEPNDSVRTICVASVDESLDKALRGYEELLPRVEKMVGDGIVQKVNGFGRFVLSDSLQRSKIAKWNRFWQLHSKDSLIANVEIAAANSGFLPSAFTQFYGTLNREYKIEPVSFFEQLPFVAPYIIADKDGRNAVLMLISVDASYAPQVLADLNVGSNIVAFDQASINGAMVEMLASDFNFVLYICSIIVFGLLLISFARIEISIVAFLPMVISWIWIMGIMGLLGIDFNIINIILATFIFGLGDDFSIFITDGLMHQYAYRSKITDSHKSAVVLSSLTMLFGIGTLVFAKHPAMLSLAYVTIIGMFCVVVAAYFIPPILFRYLVYKKGRPRMTPVTAENFFKSIYSFVVFIVASALLTVSGFVLLTVMGRSDVNKLRFHKVLCGFARFVVRYLPMVGSRVNNLSAELFDKGAVIVANHQSHLDLMYILALNPKIIIATNRWVWRSPFYGLVIRYADFFPVEMGVDNSVERLRPLVDKGYSVVIFPEGTRSPDMAIHRFHKGAFYLAQQLGVDILPVVLHGVGAALPKQEFLLRHGTVTVTVMPRMRLNQQPINDQAKQVRDLMRNQLNVIEQEVENCDYYRYLVISNYIYKGADIERRARRLLTQNDNYIHYVNQLPSRGVVVVRNCDIGVGTLIIALVCGSLTIYATDDDEKKLTLAANCAAVPANLKYVKDVSQIECDVEIDFNDER